MSDLAFVVALLLTAPTEIALESGARVTRIVPGRAGLMAYASDDGAAPPPAADTDVLPSSDDRLDAAALGEGADGEPAPAAEAPAEDMQTPSADDHDDDDDDNVIVVSGRTGPPRSDPLESVNMASFDVTQAVDVAFVRPVAKTYQRILPEQVRSGIRNFINNLREPVAFVNFLLQLKPGKAAETAGRFALNSTVGVAGLVDIAKRRPFHLPRRPNGLANTLGYYGVKPGAFLFVPLVGPTTVRDFIGDGLDRLFLPTVVGKPFSKPEVGIGLYIASSLDQRAEFDEKLEEMHQDRDPYARTREDYLQSRQNAIDALRGRSHDEDEYEYDEGGGAAAPAPVTAADDAAPTTAPLIAAPEDIDPIPSTATLPDAVDPAAAPVAAPEEIDPAPSAAPAPQAP